jgi:hypothetical protein
VSGEFLKLTKCLEPIGRAEVMGAAREKNSRILKNLEFFSLLLTNDL